MQVATETGNERARKPIAFDCERRKPSPEARLQEIAAGYAVLTI